MLVGYVVGQFELVEGHRPAHPLVAGQRRVRMDVHSLGHFRVGLSGDDPARVVELVAAVVDRDDVHHEQVLAAPLQAGNLHLERRKHPPAISHARFDECEAEILRQFLHGAVHCNPSCLLVVAG